MTESGLHRLLKTAAVRALEDDGFTIYIEPEWSPIDFISWRKYRPDILAARESGKGIEYTLVECETRPRLQRILAKNTSSIVVQARLLAETRVHKVLVIPTGSLRALDMKIRRNWTIWLMNTKLGEITRTIESVRPL